jgi:hypothetical protein
MSSEKQVAANRRNAQKSVGPKSPSGKHRSSKNAYRHGLSVPMSVRSEAQLKDLAQQFAGDASNAVVLELAERAAEAQLELERIRKVQAALIERASRPSVFDAGLLDPSAPLPGGNEEKEQLFIDAVGGALSELTKTISYEKRAIGRRDRAIRQIVSIKTEDNKSRIRSN